MTAPILIPSGPQFGVPYVLTGPDGQRAVFNDPLDDDYVGMLTDISGFDSPEIRESADDLVEMDGGLHGDFYYGRRPIVMEGMIMHDGDQVRRNMQISKLQRASSALRGDATLVWTPDGGVQQFMLLRRQQPLRVTGAWNKTFQLSMVAADPNIYSTELHSSTVAAGEAVDVSAGFGFNMIFPLNFGAAIPAGQMFLLNQGNAETFPIYYVYGPGTSPAIINMTTGKVISMLYTLGLLDVLIINTRERTVLLAQRSGVDDVINFVNTPAFEAGTNDWESGSAVDYTLTQTAATGIPSGLSQVGRLQVWVGVSPWAADMDIRTNAGVMTGTLTGLEGDKEYTLSYSINHNSATPREVTATMWFFTSAGTLISSATGVQATIASGGWYTYTHTFTAPAGTARADLSLLLPYSGTAFLSSETYDFDRIVLSRSSSATFGHGDLAGWLWASTPWNSQSRLPGLEIDMNTANDRYGVLDFTNTQWGGLMPGSNDVRLSYFAFIEGARLVADYRDASA